MHNLNGFMEGIATEKFLTESTNSKLTIYVFKVIKFKQEKNTKS